MLAGMRELAVPDAVDAMVLGFLAAWMMGWKYDWKVDNDGGVIFWP